MLTKAIILLLDETWTHITLPLADADHDLVVSQQASCVSSTPASASAFDTSDAFSPDSTISPSSSTSFASVSGGAMSATDAGEDVSELISDSDEGEWWWILGSVGSSSMAADNWSELGGDELARGLGNEAVISGDPSISGDPVVWRADPGLCSDNKADMSDDPGEAVISGNPGSSGDTIFSATSDPGTGILSDPGNSGDVVMSGDPGNSGDTVISGNPGASRTDPDLWESDPWVQLETEAEISVDTGIPTDPGSLPESGISGDLGPRLASSADNSGDPVWLEAEWISLAETGASKSSRNGLSDGEDGKSDVPELEEFTRAALGVLSRVLWVGTWIRGRSKPWWQ